MRAFRIVRPAHKCQTPIEALQLAEDLERINYAMLSISRISDVSIHNDREEGNKEILIVHSLLRKWHQKATLKLRMFLRVDLSGRD